MSEADRHAKVAAMLVAATEEAESKVSALDEEDKLSMAVTGGISRFNADQRWTVELSIAHALTSIALSLATIADRYVDEAYS